jgi:hypothetical protein
MALGAEPAARMHGHLRERQDQLLRESVKLVELALGVFPNGLADYKVPSEQKASALSYPADTV